MQFRPSLVIRAFHKQGIDDGRIVFAHIYTSGHVIWMHASMFGWLIDFVHSHRPRRGFADPPAKGNL